MCFHGASQSLLRNSYVCCESVLFSSRPGVVPRPSAWRAAAAGAFARPPSFPSTPAPTGARACSSSTPPPVRYPNGLALPPGTRRGEGRCRWNMSPLWGTRGGFLLPSFTHFRQLRSREHDICRCSLWALSLFSGDCECCLPSCTGSFRVGSVGQSAEVQLTYPSLSSSCAWYLTPTKYVHAAKSAYAAVNGWKQSTCPQEDALILPICALTARCLHALPSAGMAAACPPRTTCSCPW
jgi:hypothetical protein